MLPFILLGLLEGAVQAALLSLVAVGFSLAFGVMRILNVAHGQFFMLGAVIGWVIADAIVAYLGLSPLPTFLLMMPLTVLIIILLSMIADRLILQNLHYEPQSVIIATIGLLYIFQHGTLLVFGDEARSIDSPFYILLQLPWYGYSLYKLAIIGCAIAVLFGVWYLLKTLPSPTKRMAFALSAGLASLAGVLALPIQQAHYLMGDEVLLLAFAIVIIGGLGGFKSVIVAAVVIGMSDALVSLLFSPVLAKIIVILLVVAVLIVRPQGFGGRKHA